MTCTVPRCGKSVRCKGLCENHYHRQLKGLSLSVRPAGLRASHCSPSWFAEYLPVPERCPLCLAVGVRSWCVDHDHTCGRHYVKSACAYCVRGMICNRCNCGDIAVFERYPFLLEHPELPVRYREYFRGRPVLKLLEV